MAQIDFDLFLQSLAKFMAAEAEVEHESAPRALWLYDLVESSSTLQESPPSPASVLNSYGGSIGYVPVPHLLVQCETTGLAGDKQSAMTRAQLLHGTLLNENGRPLRMQTIEGFRINGILNLQPPTPVEMDGNDRLIVIFNFECEFVPLS